MAHVRAHRVLPGFGLSLGFTLAYLSLIVLIPLAAVFIKSGDPRARGVLAGGDLAARAWPPTG